jgi:enoyl-CoA hydratase/carnithine racemase
LSTKLFWDVDRVVPDADLETAAMELAKKLAKKSPLAIECGKQGIYGMSYLSYH